MVPPSSPPRRIRFAPLPHPRRVECAVVDEDASEEPPLADDVELQRRQKQQQRYLAPPQLHSSRRMLSSPETDAMSEAPDSASLSSTGSSKRNSYSTDPSSLSLPSGSATSDFPNPSFGFPSPDTVSRTLSAPPLASAPISAPPAPVSVAVRKKRTKALSLLHPFRKSWTPTSDSAQTSSPPPGPRPTHARRITAEGILTLGAIHLLRASSRDTDDDLEPSSAGRLSRWANRATARADSQLDLTVERTQTTQSYKSKTSSLFQTAPLTKSASASAATPRMNGARMLNGRVYGRKPPANPFANARDNEPEFVEWGYGGMGSVKGALSAGVSSAGQTRWERLHGVGITESRGTSGPGANDEMDDGSGMGWVRKRREARQKQVQGQREKEEQENGEDKAGEPRSGTPASSSTLVSTAHPAPPPESVAPHTEPSVKEDASSIVSSTIPNDVVPRRTASRRTSGLSVSRTSSFGEEHVLRAVTVPAHHFRYRVDDVHAARDGDRGEAAAASSGSDGRHSEDDGEDVSSDEEVPQEMRMRTTRGAGVEKISRHKEMV